MSTKTLGKRPASTLEPESPTTDMMSPASKRSRVDSHDFRPSSDPAGPNEDGNGIVEDREKEEEEGVAEDEEEVEEEVERESRRQTKGPAEGYDDLYLNTIDRNVLDFDFEKLCSVTLSNINVYACLVCGKYFQGRGPKSHAYFHALDEDHHVFINMKTQKIYVLPDGYEVTSSSLDDIKFVSNPQYTRVDVATLDKKPVESWTYGGAKSYIPGFVGMNNIKANDYINVIIQALAHVPPLRNYFLLTDVSKRPELVQRYSLLIRKIWNPRAFKAHVSPHELLQEVALKSSRRFSQTTPGDPVEFLGWLLNNLHQGLGGSRMKPGSSIIQKAFQGKMRVESQEITARADVGDRLRFEEAAEVKVDIVRFLFLTLDLPPAPLFQDDQEKNIIPQVPLRTILEKYNGVKSQEQLQHRKRYRLQHPLPPYLMFHVKRFTTNKFISERNPTIVTFDETGLDVSSFVEPAAGQAGSEPILYDLVANVVHEAVTSRDGGEEMRSWKVQVKDRARGEWMECQDLFVEKVRSELLFSGESYLQIWERRK